MGLQAQPIEVTPENPDVNVSHYRYPVFQESFITLDNQHTVEAQLNYNLLTREVLVDLGSTKVPYQTEGVHRIQIDTLSYLPHEDNYYEILHSDSISLLVLRSAKMDRLNQDTGLGRTTNQNARDMPPLIKDKSDNYQLHFIGSYGLKIDHQYFLYVSNQLHELKKVKDLENYYPSQFAEIKGYVKKNKLKINREADLIQIVHFLNTSN